MAKAPAARASATSGQGVSRRAYQQAYALGQRGRGSEFKGGGGETSSRRQYAKSDQSPINVSYGDTVEIGTLDDINDFGTGHYPKSSVSLSRNDALSGGKRGRKP